MDNKYRKWKTLVNMTSVELHDFMRSPEGKIAGLSKKQAQQQGIKSGRESAKWILRMKAKPYGNWTAEEKRWMSRQISFISRMRGTAKMVQKRGNNPYYRNGKPTRLLLSLKIWGHDPEKHSGKGYRDNPFVAGQYIPRNFGIYGSDEVFTVRNLSDMYRVFRVEGESLRRYRKALRMTQRDVAYVLSNLNAMRIAKDEIRKGHYIGPVKGKYEINMVLGIGKVSVGEVNIWETGNAMIPEWAYNLLISKGFYAMEIVYGGFDI